VDGRSGHERVCYAVDDDRSSSGKAEQNLLVRRVRVLAHIASRRDHLDAHREVLDPVLRAALDRRIAVRPYRLPIGFTFIGLQYDTRACWRAHDRLRPTKLR